MKKRYLAITLAVAVAAGCVLQPVTVSATTAEEEAQALAFGNAVFSGVVSF